MNIFLDILFNITKKILLSSSLKSNDCKKIKSYCAFLQTIVFNDFPAEIFLQRSSILKILIDLVIKSTNLQQQDAQSDDDFSLNKALITCFNYYCSKLKKRLNYIKDPSTFCYKGIQLSFI